MFTAVLFTTVKTWKQTKCSLTNEWIKKMWHIYATHIHTRNGILLSHEKEQNNAISATWMHLEMIILNEVSQKDKNK